MFKFTLVPRRFFDTGSAQSLLSSVVLLEENASVKYKELPHYKAVLVYTGGDERAASILAMSDVSRTIGYYNKIVAKVWDDCVDILIAQGDRLLLCNSFPASDNVTIQYFIFAALAQFQINPALTVLHFMGEVPDMLVDELFRHLKSVEVL